MSLPQSPYFDYLALPVLIFCLRIGDMTLDTLRIIFMTKGLKRLAPIIGFFEILIWIVAITRIMQHLNNWTCYLAYAGGFATGNYVGMWLDEKLAIGHELIRVITRVDATQLADALRAEGYVVTTVKAAGMEGEVGVVYIVVTRRNQNHAVQIIRQYNPNAFVTTQNIHYVTGPRDHGALADAAGSRLADIEGSLAKQKIEA